MAHKNSKKIPVGLLVGGVLLSGIVSSFTPDNTDEIPPADAIIAEATPVLDTSFIPTIESTETSAPKPTVAPTLELAPEPTIVPTLEPALEPTVVPTLEPALEPTAVPTPMPTEIPTPQPTMEPQTQPDSESTAQSMGGTGSEHGNSNFDTYDNQDQQQTEDTYVLNTSSKKIHHPSCSSVPKIAPQNYATSSESIGDLQAKGYSTCGRCFK